MKIGDQVRVLQVPTDIDKEKFPETYSVFRHCVGKTLKIEGFGRYGHIELWVNDDGTQATDCCQHSIWIEPELVEVLKPE